MPRLVSGFGRREHDRNEALVANLLKAEQLPYLHERLSFGGPIPDFCVWSYRLATLVVIEVTGAIDRQVNRYKLDYLADIEESFGIPTLFLDRHEMHALNQERDSRRLRSRITEVQFGFVRSGRRSQSGFQIQWLAHTAGLLPNPERARSVEH